MFNNRIKEQVEQEYNCTILSVQVDHDASTDLGMETYGVAVILNECVRYATLYFTIENGQPVLQWDVSGWPSWYRENTNV